MPKFTKREHNTLYDAYQYLGAALIPREGTNIAILDNLDAMLTGRKPPHKGGKLRKAAQQNVRILHAEEEGRDDK